MSAHEFLRIKTNYYELLGSIVSSYLPAMPSMAGGQATSYKLQANMLTYILFILGFPVLIKGADILIDGASSIAKKFRVSDLMIGLTIIAFGTSAPELIVNLIASFRGSTDLAVGNVFGSNISNILLILGITAIIYPLAMKRGTVWKEVPFSLLAIVAVAFLANDLIIDGVGPSLLSRIDGVILLLFFIIFIYYTFGLGKLKGEEKITVKVHSMPKSFLLVAIGAVALALGGQWIVNGAVEIAKSFGISEAFIGLTIVAIGTSLPELATSVVAATKKNADIAVGNIVGSNVFNLLWILGLSATIKPLSYSIDLNFDGWIVIMATFLLFIFMFIGKKQILERWQGIAFVGIYVFYILYLIYRG